MRAGAGTLMPALRVLKTVALVTAWAVTAGCGDKPSARNREAGPPRILKLDELTPAERRFGHSATPSKAVTYQPDVVMLPAGADAVRSVSPDGLAWTLDPDAENAQDIRTGSVLLLTSRAAGRVLGVRKTPEGLQVILGPVQITEVVREGRFTLDQPIDLDHALSFTVPSTFDPRQTVAPIVSRSHYGGPELLARAERCGPASPGTLFRLAAARLDCDPSGIAVGRNGVNQVTVHRFKLQPLVDSRGIGVRITSDAGGVHFMGEAALFLKAPRMRFNLDIKGGAIVTCEVELDGAAGLMMTFEAASPNPTSANINEKRFAPVDFSIPLTGMGVPFAVNVRQIFQLQTAFTSTGTLKARVYYELKGGLSTGYRDGKWSVGGPTGVKPVLNLDQLLHSTQGVTMGVTGMVMTHHANVMIGIGAFGFLTGPYGFLNSSVTVTNGSSAGAVICKQGTLSMGVGAGVGYRIPQPVTGAINSILRALNIREEIQEAGGIQTDPVIIVSMGRYYPSLDICGNK
jgi:hypothetical protein